MGNVPIREGVLPIPISTGLLAPGQQPGCIFVPFIKYSDLPNRRIVALNETMTKFAQNAKRDNPINRDDGKFRK